MSDGTELVTATEDLAAIATKHAAESDAARMLRPEVVDGMILAGFARHLVPTGRGGTAGTFTALLQAVTTLGTGCASAAWVASLIAGAGRMGAYLPVEGQAELWAAGPDTLVAGALTPTGHAERHGGDWRVSGEWQFTSGVDFSRWALVCALVDDEGGRRPWFFAVPRSAYRIEDTWFTVGMRATGSNTLLLDEVVVPSCRGFARDRMLAGTPVDSPARCHTVPLRLVSGLLFAAPALGAAMGALRSWSDSIATKREHDGRPAQENTSTQLVLARAAGEIEAARLLLERAADVGDHGVVDHLTPARNARDVCLAVELLVSAVDRLFAASGTRGQSEANPIQRAWRDVHCMASHIALRFDTAGIEFAKAALKSI